MIPNWRSFGKSVILGELDSCNKNNAPRIVTSIDEYIIDWKVNGTLVHASELLSAAIVNNLRNDINVIEAAKFILNNSKNANYSHISTAKMILSGISSIDIKSDDITRIEILNDQIDNDIANIKRKITDTKLLLRKYPTNPILYTELSRYYSIIGNEKKAIEAMKIALHFSKDNRFILRCATRLFTHYGNPTNDYIDYIHKILVNSIATQYDPWLTSAEISLSGLKGVSSKNVKKGIELATSKNIMPAHISELSSALATIELSHGNRKKSRSFFENALISPNDNTLAQVEWAMQKDKSLIREKIDFSQKYNYEAESLKYFNEQKYELSVFYSARWFIDMPYSIRSLLFGSYISSNFLKDQKKSIILLQAGLKGHQNDPKLINNLAYALSLDGKPNEALIELNKIKYNSILDSETKACVIATEGLANYRLGNEDDGRAMYLKALEITKSINNETLNRLALLNLAREEIRINSKYISNIIDTVKKIPEFLSEPEVVLLKKEVLDQFEVNINKTRK